MGYFDKATFDFLSELKQKNDRAWFSSNKERYEQDLKEPLLDFITDAGPRLHKISRQIVADPRPVGGSLFRIYRDTRFSKDKTPYKTHAGAHFQVGGKGVHGPGYYLHIEPGQCFVAGGMWMPEPPTLQAVRERIATKSAEWKGLRATIDDGHGSLKRPPRGFDPEHPFIEDIKRKSFTSSVRLTQKQVTGPDLMDAFIEACTKIAPLMKFLSSAADVAW